jgi:hypothetical protein
MKVKYEAVCESGNTDADTVIGFPDRESADIFCQIWRTSHPGTHAWVRETQHRYMEHNTLGRSVMTVDLYD